jgi:hypothetical protein
VISTKISMVKTNSSKLTTVKIRKFQNGKGGLDDQCGDGISETLIEWCFPIFYK